MLEGEEPPAHFESLRLFALCEATRWSHLPVQGGWYDQHPLFVDELAIIFEERGAYNAAKEKLEKDSTYQFPGSNPSML